MGKVLGRVVSVLSCPAWGCGLDGDGSGSASAQNATSTEVDTIEPGSSSSSASGTTATTTTIGDTSTGDPFCPGNVANEPFCYRRVELDWYGELGRWDGPGTARVGNFGPSGEEAYLLAGQDAGTPMALAFWDGENFDVQPWGVVPEFDYSQGRIPVRMLDGVHSDLAVGRLDESGYTLAIAPWTVDGPGDPVVVESPTADYVVSLFYSQVTLDVEGDGFEEIAVYVRPGVIGRPYGNGHRLVGNVEGIPTFRGGPITHAGACGPNLIMIGAGDIDGDGHVDLAGMGSCEVRELGGVFAFAAEWGDGSGEFVPADFEYAATTPNGWLGVADLDGDGLDDVVTGSQNNVVLYERYLELHRSRGDRTFEPPLKFWTDGSPPGSLADGNVATSPRHYILGDVDGDGVHDLVLRDFVLAMVQIGASPRYLTMFDLPWDLGTTEVVSAFDFNHDGRIDFVVSDEISGAHVLISSA